MRDTQIIPILESHFSDQQDAVICILVKDMEQAEATRDHIAFFLPEKESIIVPSYELLPYDNQNLSSSSLSEQIKALHSVVYKKAIYIVCSQSLFEIVQPKESFISSCYELKKENKITPEELISEFKKKGYSESSSVREHGQYTAKGHILDVFPIGSEHPVRLHFKKGQISEIYEFDSLSQLNKGTVDSATMYPNFPIPFDEASRERFCKHYWDMFSVIDENYSKTKAGILIDEALSYAAFFIDGKHSILEYFPKNTQFFTLTDIVEDTRRFESLCEFRYKEVSVTHNAIPSEDAFILSEVPELVEQYSISEVDDGDKNVPVRHEDIRTDKASATLRNVLKWTKFTEKVVVCVNSEGREKQLKTLFSMRNKRVEKLNCWQDAIDAPSGIYLIFSNIQQGLYSEKNQTVIFSEKEFFGTQSFTDLDYSNDTSELEASIEETPRGFPMTHISKGVGRFMGLVKPDMDGVGDREYVLLEYANDASIYVPIDKLDMLAEYNGIDPEDIPLDDGTGQKWIKKLGSLESDLSEVAETLILTKLSHKVHKRTPYTKNNFDYNKFASGFSYMLTQDQHAAINDIIADLTGDIPMDRLLVGDVGYGKTEIAMRACFLVANNQKQCCVIAPTTLLAAQHYETFKARFSGFNIKIGLLTRKNKSEEKEILRQLEEGEIDIIVGTHRLIQDDISIPNLGLLVIDEEHRFGVKQKQAISGMKSDVDVLSLTATPIPRTLSSALHGVRSVSTIRTPPAKRLSIRTEMSELSDDIIRSSIQREMLRNGQAFFLHNDISTISDMAERIKSIVPEAKVEFAHGKMNELEMFDLMSRFSNHEFDVLVSTTIIETGIDIPNANTLLINNSEKLGLAQLHQIRGRVGRGRRQAYAYLLSESLDDITEVAKKRLKALCENTNLGGGFKLSAIDMEIRGAGEILGEKQSGHIHSLGYDLYFKLLDTAIQQLERDPEFVLSLMCQFDKEKVDEVIQKDNEKVIEVETNINMNSSIPDSYISDESVRMYIYRRIIKSKNSDDLQKIKREVIDRYGEMPRDAEDVFAFFEAKRMLPIKGIKSVTRKNFVYTVCSEKDLSTDQEESLSSHLGHECIVSLINEREIQIIQSKDSLQDICLHDIYDGLFK